MTTIDERPSSVAESAIPNGPSASRRGAPGPRRHLWRKLPYAVAVLTLAAGYAIGHSTDNPAPKASAAAPAIVTPEQINQALATTNGHPVVNDRGYSQLDNGVQHSHGFDLPMTAAEHKLLSHQLNLAREVAMRYPTLADAESAGMRSAGPFSPGLGLHVGGGAAGFGYAAGAGPMTDAQIEHPLQWIYDGTKPDSPVAGLFYASSVDNPQGFAGPNDVWHTHTNLCLAFKPGGGIRVVPTSANPTAPECTKAGGFFVAQTGKLLHTWVVPGYEDSQGVFAHLNPAITCNDGTYHLAPEPRRSAGATACADGTE